MLTQMSGFRWEGREGKKRAMNHDAHSVAAGEPLNQICRGKSCTTLAAIKLRKIELKSFKTELQTSARFVVQLEHFLSEVEHFSVNDCARPQLPVASQSNDIIKYFDTWKIHEFVYPNSETAKAPNEYLMVRSGENFFLCLSPSICEHCKVELGHYWLKHDANK